MRTEAIISEQALNPNLTPASIAAQLNISLRQLYRAFTGTESPTARIRRRRLEHAAEILAARSRPGRLEQVSTECGFASADYFSRTFRRECRSVAIATDLRVTRRHRKLAAQHRDRKVRIVVGWLHQLLGRARADESGLVGEHDGLDAIA